MTTWNENPEVYNYVYIHNVFGHFFKDTLDYFSNYLYPRTQWKVISTYDKAVEYLNKKNLLGRENDKPLLPGMILNPSGDFKPDEANSGGRFLWRYPNLAPWMIKRIYDPIYQDQNVLINVGFMRMQGEIELLFLASSYYEYADFKMLAYMIFGGEDRPIYPQYFNSFIILPRELMYYQYENDITGLTYQLNWDNPDIETRLIKSTNQEEIIFPCSIKPLYKLTGMSDASEKYGGIDKLSDWRLNVSVQFEVELPSWLLISTNYLATSFSMNLGYGSTYTNYSDYQVPEYIEVERFDIHTGIDNTSNTIVNMDEAVEVTHKDTVRAIFKNRYYHILTQAEVDSTSDLQIQLSEQITDSRYIIVHSKYGKLEYGDYYTIDSTGFVLTVSHANVIVNLEEGDVIELYVYVDKG